MYIHTDYKVDVKLHLFKSRQAVKQAGQAGKAGRQVRPVRRQNTLRDLRNDFSLTQQVLRETNSAFNDT